MNSFEGLDWFLIHHVDVDFVVDVRKVFQLAEAKAGNINTLKSRQENC